MPRGKSKDTANLLAQFGIPDLDLNEDIDNDDVGDDEDLETELQALLSGKSVAKPVHKSKQVMNIMDVEKMANDCMREVSIDDDDDDNLSGDEDILNELQELAGKASDTSSPSSDVQQELVSMTSEDPMVQQLSERLNLYKEAEAAAKSCKDNSKIRRYGRAIKTLESQLLTAKAHGIINEEDIPPIVTIPKKNKPSQVLETQDESPASSACVSEVPDATQMLNQPENVKIYETTTMLTERRNEYKIAALQAKKSGDMTTALHYVRIAKEFDAVIDAHNKGEPIDLQNCPPRPPEYLADSNTKVIPSQQSESISTPEVQTPPSSEEMQKAALEAANEPPDPTMFGAPPPPTTILEALQQRLDKYTSTRDAAKAEGNNGKVRRLQRIVKQYEDAIKSYKSGSKVIDFEELPTPPGFGPIPIEDKTSAPNKGKKESDPVSHAASKPKPVVPPQSTELTKRESPQGPSGRNPKVQRANTSSILDRQLQFLLERQKLFRQAALESKKNGDIQQAKEYLRAAKGFDALIDATTSGLPIDATTIPTPPQLDSDFVIVDKTECFNADCTENSDSLFATLEKELQQQIKMCDRNKDHFLSLGDVSSASKFEKWSLDSKKDLVAIQHMWRNSEPCPVFHYETRLISLVRCNTELADKDIEVSIERGINLPGKPEELDSYIRIEFPIPAESPQRAKTHTVKDTNNPIFQEVFKFEINRKSRSQLRLFKRQVLKCEVWSKGGFFRGDSLLGVANVKLTGLETKCVIHDCFDLMEARKACGGKLEVKVKIRDPLLVKQVEEVREKWLVIDGYSSSGRLN